MALALIGTKKVGTRKVMDTGIVGEITIFVFESESINNDIEHALHDTIQIKANQFNLKIIKTYDESILCTPRKNQ